MIKREGDIYEKRIAVVFGGNSVEHEISILSMIQVSHAIDRARYDVIHIYITKKGEFWVGPGLTVLKLSESPVSNIIPSLRISATVACA